MCQISPILNHQQKRNAKSITTTVGHYTLQRGALLLLCWTNCHSTWGTIHTLLNISIVSSVLTYIVLNKRRSWVSSDIKRRAHLSIQRWSFVYLDNIEYYIVPYYVGLNYTCSSMTTWGSLNYERVSFINVGRYYKLSYIHIRGASARRLNNLRHEFNWQLTTTSVL